MAHNSTPISPFTQGLWYSRPFAATLEKTNKDQELSMSISDKSFHEKRDFIRMKIDAPLEATLTGDAGRFSGECTELSGGGMQVLLDTALAEGSEWEVNITSEHGHSPQLRAIVKIVRVEEKTDAGYPTGFQITEVIN